MLKHKTTPVCWVTPLGSTVYENLNSFWACCEAMSLPPQEIFLLYEQGREEEKNLAESAFEIVSQSFNLKGKIRFSALAFENENVRDFNEKTDALFEIISEKSLQVLVDVSPSTRSFVTAKLIQTTRREYRELIRDILYLAYSVPGDRDLPYALIPRKGVRLSTFTNKGFSMNNE